MDETTRGRATDRRARSHESTRDERAAGDRTTENSTSRRRYLGGLGAALAGGLAGCSGVFGQTGTSGGAATTSADPSTSAGTDTPNATTASATTRVASATSGPATTANDSTGEAESPYTRVYQESIQSVVLITASTPEGTGKGSGFVYRDNYLVTNEHVVSDATELRVQFNQGETTAASVVGTDVSSDLAVIEVESTPDYASALARIEAEPAIGTEVVAIGNPYGRFDGSASAGIVSGINRSIPAQNGFTIPDAIQTDAAVNPGNSGGPLVNLDGRVVGVINSGGGENIAFAISAALVERVIPALVEDGEYEHAYLGVSLATVTPAIAEANDLDRARGVYVHEVRPEGPAAGVLQGSQDSQRPVGGDVIVGLGDTEIATREELSSYLALEASPGETIDVTVLRDGERTTVELELGARPERSPAASGESGTPVTR